MDRDLVSLVLGVAIMVVAAALMATALDGLGALALLGILLAVGAASIWGYDFGAPHDFRHRRH